ncbi:peptide-methionine (S)-S-oxide reductase MsrA [Aliiruegeria sabulilitoris]|uniref:peptide-methionine (S)-S-oxide reductase MsrA n=1 Tax=Aliiruegeria sabulilitoris TaxID=1510458 RepID=UPI000832B397|nr:peptide-methionine (S)-S-oxide reductase MsrA [Aliiruegeria sabulilitoris]NDR55089.1 peptide-methionine (S)-S-oxide reductase MsrA [Pseudoruegeria sp. M32A2M]
MFLTKAAKMEMIRPEDALPGRAQPIPTAPSHHVFHRPLTLDIPEGMEAVMLGMGCFWGAERLLWQLPGVWLTMVGYSGGTTPNPTYEETCTARTGHAEVVRVVFDPAVISFEDLLRCFWESHDPTQGMRQGGDIGTQYRSAIYASLPAHLELALDSCARYQKALTLAGRGQVTTEISAAGPFYFAEDYHQQYLAKNPGGYCGIGGTGVACPVGTGVSPGN